MKDFLLSSSVSSLSESNECGSLKQMRYKTTQQQKKWVDVRDDQCWSSIISSQ